MKKLVIVFLFSLIQFHLAIAQDIIYKRNGDEIKSKVSEVTSTEIKFKKSDNLDGPMFTILKSEVMMIKYSNGTKDVFQINEPKQQEAFYDNPYAERTKEPRPPRKPTKYLNITQLGGGLPTGEVDYGNGLTYKYSGLFSVSTIHGYKLVDQFSIAGGMGIDVYDIFLNNYSKTAKAVLPVFFDFRYSVLGENTSPVLYFDIGNTFGHDRGLMIEPGFAFKIKIGASSIHISSGYKIQKAKSTYYRYGIGDENVILKYFSFRLGISI